MAKAARGRKPDEGAMRTASGRKSRSKESLGLAERLTLEAATWRRRQENPDLTISEARLPEHGSVIARWLEEWNREPRRVCRRLQLLSKVEHHEQDNEQVFSGSA